MKEPSTQPGGIAMCKEKKFISFMCRQKLFAACERLYLFTRMLGIFWERNILLEDTPWI